MTGIMFKYFAPIEFSIILQLIVMSRIQQAQQMAC